MSTTLQACAGTLESNDVFIAVSAGEDAENTVSLESMVMKQFGPAILETINGCLAEYGMRGIRVEAKDKGALDCTIKARMEAAIIRYKESLS